MKNSIAISAVIFTVSILTLPIVWSDNDFRWEEMEEHRHKSSDVASVTNPLYKEECGSCHMAYPPSLLPAKSWNKLMAGLEDHFGDNAELDEETAHSISQYLQQNSAELSDYRRAGKFLRSINSNETPMRISDIPYFKHEHDEIPQRLVAENEQVKSFSQCNACHTKAEQGKFNEHDVRIPGYGQWDD